MIELDCPVGIILDLRLNSIRVALNEGGFFAYLDDGGHRVYLDDFLWLSRRGLIQASGIPFKRNAQTGCQEFPDEMVMQSYVLSAAGEELRKELASERCVP